MKRGLVTYAILSLLVLPPITSAGMTGDHGSMQMMEQHGDHGSMQMMNAQTIMLGEETVEGVKAMAHINDIGAMMTQMGKKENYHFMLMFNDATTGAAIAQGTVAVKITDPKTGQTGEAIPLMGMGGHFGADIILSGKGAYDFQVGSKLADGKTRQFHFHYTVK